MNWDDVDPEGPSPEDLERFGDEWVTCPECGSAIYDQTEICPRCGHALTSSDGGKTPVWAIVAAVLALIAFVLVFVL